MILISFLSVAPVCEPPPLLQEAPLRPEPVVSALRVAPQALGQGVRPGKDLPLDGRSVDLRINDMFLRDRPIFYRVTYPLNRRVLLHAFLPLAG